MSVIFCCITIHPKGSWLKRTNIQTSHDSVDLPHGSASLGWGHEGWMAHGRITHVPGAQETGWSGTESLS